MIFSRRVTWRGHGVERRGRKRATGSPPEPAARESQPWVPAMEPIITNNERQVLMEVNALGPAAQIDALYAKLRNLGGKQWLVNRLNSLSRIERGYLEKHWPTAYTITSKGKKEIGA